MPMSAMPLRIWLKDVLVLAVSCCVLPVQGTLHAAPGEQLQINSIYQSAICGTITESQWLANQQQYETTYQALNQGIISDSKPKPVPIDFSRYGVLLVSMGQQQTGGYAVKLASSQVEVANGRAKIQVNWVTKAPGTMTVQMLTNPCLLLKIPGTDFDVIDVIDQSGKVRVSVAVR